MNKKLTFSPDIQQMLSLSRYLSEAVDAKDPYTFGHMDRVARYSMKILDQLPERNDIAFREMLVTAAMLHDIGKIKVPDNVLKKSGKLDPYERMEMELHPLHSISILGHGFLVSWLVKAILTHHEFLNGSGYPNGLKSNQIPLAARIITVADIFDAITSKRLYHDDNKKYSDKTAFKILKSYVKEGYLDKRAVDAFKAAYDKCEILMVKASSYSDVKNPLLAKSGGDYRPILVIARKALEEALKQAKISFRKVNKREKGFWEKTQLRILIRLATLANFQGKPDEALKYLDKAWLLARGLKKYRKRIIIQRAYSYRELGRMTEVEKNTKQLAKMKNVDWINASVNILLAKVALDFYRLEKVDEYVNKAKQSIQQMKKKVEGDSVKSPLGVKLRWWSSDRIAWLEGMINLINTRRLQRHGDVKTVEAAQKTIEHFESYGYVIQASNSRIELARFLSNQGCFDRAIFYLERERELAETVGNTLGIIKTKIWLAETYSRMAACTSNGVEASKYEQKALEVLEDSLIKLGKERKPTDILCKIKMGMALTYWHVGKNEKAKKLAKELLNIVNKYKEPGFNESRLVAKFILLCIESGLYEKFIELADEAKAAYLPIREIEFLTEAVSRFPKKTTIVQKRIKRLIKRMGGICWLCEHPYYKKILAKIIR